MCILSATVKTSIDARALVMQVAEKHDSIVKYRNEINAMEEELKRKDVHIYFKDEIIRDLRRECKKVLLEDATYFFAFEINWLFRYCLHFIKYLWFCFSF